MKFVFIRHICSVLMVKVNVEKDSGNCQNVATQNESEQNLMTYWRIINQECNVTNNET
jgi:hypothetical protein